MILIGLCGRANSGKDTVAALLPATSSIAFADPIYEAVAAVLGVPVDTLRDRDFKEAVVPWVGKSPRVLMQTLGTDWGRKMVCDDLWIKIARIRIRNGGQFVVVRDVRFDNEASMILEEGGEVWLVERPGASTCVPHESEAGVSEALITRTVRNSGTIRDLAAEVANACADMVRRAKIKESAA